MGTHWYRAWMALPTIIVCLAGLVTGATIGRRIAPAPPDDYSFFDEIVEIKHIISNRYVSPVDDDKLREGAIRGMVEALDDPYTVYVPASEARAFTKDLLGEYVGIGAQVNVREGYLHIVSPLEDSPAFRAGLMADDKVLEIDGRSTLNIGVDECVQRLLGEPGTTVRLTIERAGQRFEVTITRDHIKTRAVKGVRRSPNDPEAWEFTLDPQRGIAYIRLTQFTPGCAEEVADAIRKASSPGGHPPALVLDLRFNPGGLLREAEEIADLFLDSGVIVSTRGRAHPEVVRHAKKEGTLPDFPLVVLLNAQSASASEVLAGALVENERAIVVGTRSFGKGSVQSVIEITHGKGSELKITEQAYYLPSGRSITRRDDSPTWGVDPTNGYYVPMTDEELIAMLDVRRKREVLTAQTVPPDPGEKWDDPAWIHETQKDPQLSAALRAIQIRIDTGQWQPVGEPTPAQQAIASSEFMRLSRLHERLVREIERTERRMEALESGHPAPAPGPELWDAAINVSGGTLELRDRDGRVVATYEITGPDLRDILSTAPLKKK
jgi:carboxyl-terminal processing protease